MKSYFLQLFEYDDYANQLLITTIAEAGSHTQAVKLMAHILAAQQIWLARCKAETNLALPALWPTDWLVNDLQLINRQNNKNWMEFLEGIDNYNNTLSYKNSTGQEFRSSITDILTHLINHGTHHRAQAGQVLKSNGFSALPNTDYITYLRNNQK